MGIQVYFKGGNTIKNFLVAPKVKENITQKSGVIYRYECERLECDENYIEEFSRTFEERLKEHFRAPSSMYDCANFTGHHTGVHNFSIVGRKSHSLAKTIKEAMYKGQ